MDSLTVLRNNRLNVPTEHSNSIKKNILVYGVDRGVGGQASEEEGKARRKFQEIQEALQPIVSSVNTELVSVYTNLRYLDDNNNFYTQKWHGSLLAALAHALSGMVHTVHIGSTFDYKNMTLWGSTPLMDPLYSGSQLQVVHDGARFTRLEKVRLLSSWSEAIDNLHVCTVNRPGKLNCGQCEKCIRTKMELAVVGRLAPSDAFSDAKVATEFIVEQLDIGSPFAAACYEEVLPPLRDQGQVEVADALEAKLQAYRVRRRRIEERDWRGAIKRGLRALNLYK